MESKDHFEYFVHETEHGTFSWHTRVYLYHDALSKYHPKPIDLAGVESTHEIARQAAAHAGQQAIRSKK